MQTNYCAKSARLAVLFVALAAAHVPTWASSAAGLTVTLNCANYDYSNYTLTLDRQNTATPNVEAYAVRVFDGNGTVLYSYNNTLSFGVILDPGSNVAYTATPAANPLTYQFYSLAGNGLQQLMWYTTTGACPGLPLAAGGAVSAVPTLNEWALLLLSAGAAGLGAQRLRKGRKLG